MAREGGKERREREGGMKRKEGKGRKVRDGERRNREEGRIDSE